MNRYLLGILSESGRSLARKRGRRHMPGIMTVATIVRRIVDAAGLAANTATTFISTTAAGLALGLGAAPLQAAEAPSRTVVVAQIVPRSGPLANVGKEIDAVTRVAFDEFNGSQGELELRLVSHDDGNVGERSAELATKVPNDVMAYLSCFGTVGCLAQQKVAGTRRVPLIGPIAGAPGLRGPGSGMVYAVRASANDEVKTLLTYMHTTGLSPVAVLVQDDGFGRAYAAELGNLRSAFQDLDIQTLTFNPSAPDFGAVVARMRAAKPKALLLLANAAHSTAFLDAWREQVAMPFVFNLAGQANAMFANRLMGYTGAAAFVTVTSSPWANRNLLQRDYRRAAERTGLPMSYLGYEAYINARLLIDSLQRSRARNATELGRYLDTLQSHDIGGVVIDYAQKRRGSSFTDMSILRNDGKYVH